MRLLEAPATLLSAVAIFLATSSPVSAGPFSKLVDIGQQEVEKLSSDDYTLQNTTLERRGGNCAAGTSPCGYYGQVCCLTGSQTCGVNAANEAICVNGAVTVAATAPTGTGAWQYYTSVWVTTGLVTMTSVYSSWVPTVTGAAAGICQPNYANMETGCGPICCTSGQYCFDQTVGVCKPAGNGGFTTTGVAGSPPTRPTTSGGVIITQTISPTTTVAYQTPLPAGASSSGNATVIASSSGGLSGGAIAGIVIGVIAGIILLLLICLCCCFKAGLDGIMALFGGKKKHTHVEEEYVEHHRRYGSAAAGSDRRWYGSGGRPGRPPPPPSEKKSGIGRLGALGLGLGGLAVALGLKRKHDKKHENKSDVSSSYDSYYYSESSTADSRSRRESRSRR